MSPFKTTLVMAAFGLAVASGFSALSLHMNSHNGNGGDDGRSALYGSHYTSTEPTVYADDPQFDHTKGAVHDN